MSILRERQTLYVTEEEHKAILAQQRQIMLDFMLQKMTVEGENIALAAQVSTEDMGMLRREGDPGIYVTIQEPWPEGFDPSEPYVPPVEEEEAPADEIPPEIDPAP